MPKPKPTRGGEGGAFFAKAKEASRVGGNKNNKGGDAPVKKKEDLALTCGILSKAEGQ